MNLEDRLEHEIELVENDQYLTESEKQKRNT